MVPTFKVTFADRETGRESHITVEATDKHDAMAKVQDGKTLVSGVVEVVPSPTTSSERPQPGAPTDPTEALLVEVRELRRELSSKVAKGILLGMLAWLGLVVALGLVYGLVVIFVDFAG